MLQIFWHVIYNFHNKFSTTKKLKLSQTLLSVVNSTHLLLEIIEVLCIVGSHVSCSGSHFASLFLYKLLLIVGIYCVLLSFYETLTVVEYRTTMAHQIEIRHRHQGHSHIRGCCATLTCFKDFLDLDDCLISVTPHLIVSWCMRIVVEILCLLCQIPSSRLKNCFCEGQKLTFVFTIVKYK